ncbi:hypothetical protein OS493_026577 [Desmophyllum pertusum]|uniref:Uncharacterized protein n=1 Tax=Desmophyllum pertusum TaxID=174260 RepID=A0A9X0CFE8_9CNID|nr:hypothetical protein OS493_026577 [Desmophyllum pertusum]
MKGQNVHRFIIKKELSKTDPSSDVRHPSKYHIYIFTSSGAPDTSTELKFSERDSRLFDQPRSKRTNVIWTTQYEIKPDVNVKLLGPSIS